MAALEPLTFQSATVTGTEEKAAAQMATAKRSGS